MKITIKGATKVYKGNKKKNIADVYALNNLDLVVESGELFGVLGPSGCGKSSLLYALSGLKPCDKGEILFDDENVTQLSPDKRDIGFVFQDYALYPNLTVYENIRFPLIGVKIRTIKVDEKINRRKLILKILTNKNTLNNYIEEIEALGMNHHEEIAELSHYYGVAFSVAEEIYEIYEKAFNNSTKYQHIISHYEHELNRELGRVLQYGYELGENGVLLKRGDVVPEHRKLTADEIDLRIREVAKMVDIEHILERKPDELSGGEQQRVAIARAIIFKPKVLLFDEPLSNLDANLRLHTREQIKKIQRETGITTIFVTHDQDEAMAICDRIAVMKDGKIAAVGAPQDLYDNPPSLFVAKFIGVPPVLTFNGRIDKKTLSVGGQKLAILKKSRNEDVIIAIRPEAFYLANNKTSTTLEFEVASVSKYGKDMIAEISLPGEEKTQKIFFETKRGLSVGTHKLAINKEKIFVYSLFGERIPIE